MITVNCSDGKIQIGGSFEIAKNLVKSKGGKFDWNTKEWTISLSMIEFDADKVHLPVTVISGNASNRMRAGDHITRYGNSYSESEWNEIEKDPIKNSRYFYIREIQEQESEQK